MNLRVLILDQTHGGDKIGREYMKLGHDVTLVDVYHTVKAETRHQLESEGFRLLSSTPSEHFDIAVSPIHCPDPFLGKATFDRRLTHHAAVGELVRFRMPVVEVTGAGAKTSTCFTLATILGKLGKRVLLHSSRGDFEVVDGPKAIRDRTSVAPSSLVELAAVDGYDIVVVEESLGGCGLGEVCAITTLGDNYPIAAGTRKAFDGKVQMIDLARRKVVIPEIEREMWAPHVRDGVDVVTFGGTGDVRVEFEERLQLGVPLAMRVDSPEGRYQVDLPSTFLAPSYTTAFETALAICMALGIEMEKAVGSLAGFDGVPGRGDVEREGDWYFVREKNPGVTARSIEWNLNILEQRYRVNDIGIVIDPMDRKICEKLDVPNILEMAKGHPSVKKVYLFNREGTDRMRWTELAHIENAFQVWAQHKVVLWCTKEGYQ